MKGDADPGQTIMQITTRTLRPIFFTPLLLLFGVLLFGCSEEFGPVRGFIPPEGDVVRGEQLFVEYNCHSCHTIPDKEFPEPEFDAPFRLPIGGKVYRVRNSGELMTAVINPDHVISGRYRTLLEQSGREAGLSPMPDFSQQMTVAELIDLVAFLHEQYTRLQPMYHRGFYLSD